MSGSKAKYSPITLNMRWSQIDFAPIIDSIWHFSAKNKIEYFPLLDLLIENLTMYNNTTAPQRDILLSAEDHVVSCDFDMDCTDDSEG
jgi:hypothetical protein